MKLLTALQTVIRTPENSYDCEISNFLADFGFTDYYQWSQTFGQRLKGYWLDCHICTDTHVGWSALYLDDQLVGSASQVGRKYDYEITYLNREAAERVRAFVAECLPDASQYRVATPDDLDMELPEEVVVFSYPFGEFILPPDYQGTYRGRNVSIKSHADVNDRNHIAPTITVYDDITDERLVIPVNEYMIKLRVQNPEAET